MSDRPARTLALALVAVLALVPLAAAVAPYEPVSNDISLQTNSGVSVTTGAHGGGMELTTPFVDDETVALATPNGNLTVSGSGQASLSVASFGPPLELDQLSVSNTAVTVNPPNQPALTIEGETDNLTYFTPTLDDGSTDLRYAGASGSTTVTFRGLQPDTTVSVIDTAHNQQLLEVGETDANGNLTVTLPNSDHTVELQSGSSTAPPDLSNLSPSGEISQTPVTASVDVDDDDFDSAAEEVQVTIFVDGSQVHQQNVTSPGTVSTTVSPSASGQHTLRAEAVDAFGNGDSVQTTFGVPGNLQVLNESDVSQAIPNANATFSFVGNDTVVSRTSNNNGNVPLAGMPLDRPVIVEVEHDNYYSRSYFFTSLADQHTAYLLNSTVTTSDIVFVLDDQTGRFSPPQEVALRIKKPIDVSGSGTEYVTVVSDRFDATESLPVTLEEGERYRLEVVSPSGEVRSIGNYVVAGDDPNAVLTIGTVQLVGDTDGGQGFAAALTTSAGNRIIRYQYVDPDETTAELNITIHRRGNASNVLLPETTVGTDLGRLTGTQLVPASAPDDVAYSVIYNATLDDGTEASGVRFVGDVPEIAPDLGLSGNVLNLAGWFLLLGLTGLVAIVDRTAAAVVATATASALTWIGALPIPAPLLGIAGAITVLMAYGRTTTHP